MSALLTIDRAVLVRGGRTLFDPIDLVLRPGEALALTGRNGVGKSSLLRLAAGLLSPKTGSVTACPCALADERDTLDPELPLGRALRFWARIDGADDRLEFALAAMGLQALSGVPVRYLSAGQRKRAVLARVVLSPALLWLLDEPANALDADGLARLSAAVTAHCEAGGAVLAATHAPLPGAWTTRALDS